MAWYLIVHLVVMGLGIIAGAFRFKLLARSVRWFYLLLLISFLTEMVAWGVGKVFKTNIIVFHFFIVIQFALVALAYQQELTKYKQWILLSVIGLLSVSFLNTLLKFDSLFVEYPTTVRTCSNLLIVAWSLIYLKTLLDTTRSDSFTEYPLFWISIGWLLFIGVTFFSLGAFNFINTSNSSFRSLFQYLRITANFALYVLFIIAFISKQRTL